MQRRGIVGSKTSIWLRGASESTLVLPGLEEAEGVGAGCSAAGLCMGTAAQPRLGSGFWPLKQLMDVYY